MKKFLAAGIMSCVMMVASVMPAFAAWEGSDAAGWKWKKPDGSYITAEWEWIDDNGDSIFEAYCFDENGICFLNTKIGEDTVNEVGQWIKDGKVQKKNGAGPGGVDANATEKAYRDSTTLDEYISKLTYTGVDGTEVAKIYSDGKDTIIYDVTIPQTAAEVSPEAIKKKYYGDDHYKIMQNIASGALRFYGSSKELTENIYSSDGQLLYTYTYYGRPVG